jgi:hypothetical protein
VFFILNPYPIGIDDLGFVCERREKEVEFGVERRRENDVAFLSPFFISR